MSDDPFAGLGLKPVQLADQQTFNTFFASLREPLSDYTFSQIFTWRNSLHLVWKILAGHLCVFANGSGDLTLLMPPIGDGGSDAALHDAFDLMNTYNASRGVPDRSRVEYTSEELLARFDLAKLDATPMGADYVYNTQRMIDLAGGDLSSKRQAKNRFLRLCQSRVETYDPAKHLEGCLALLQGWRTHQEAQHLEEPNASAIKRQKETIATELALRSASDLGFKGMVVYAKEASLAPATEPSGSAAGSSGFSAPALSIRGFTFGEYLGTDQSSIIIEKTDLDVKGLAQFIFSEFCRRHWADRPLCNVGDDWGLESLAWTKMSYRPVKMLQKYSLRQTARVSAGYQPTPDKFAAITIRPATKDDLAATVELERACFASDLSLKKRQLQYLQQRSTAVFLVAEQDGRVIGEGIALVRHHKGRLSGRIYSLAVDSASRGKKIGHQLLQTMLAELNARGVKRIYLEVEQTNTAAIVLYQRNGFRSIGSLPNYYGRSKDAVHMMRDTGEIPVPLKSRGNRMSVSPGLVPSPGTPGEG